MDLLGWFSVLDFPMEDCKQEVKDGKAVLWLPRTPRRSCGCGYHPGEQGRSGKVVGAVRCQCKAGGCAVLGSEIMAARFHRQILHLCGFLFLLLCTIFFFSAFCSFRCRGKVQPFQPLGSKFCTGIKLNTNSQKGSDLITCEMLTCWRVSSAPILELLFFFSCSTIPLADASQTLTISPGSFL